ncbi:hypothetical protein [Aeromicrobium ginsengisoli]|uniref:Uncharacterized protein n=1 Tax=Aeromicrobium ginsengisoli TaxID=363867 RepID=A0A5M4FHI5_9ACTN|nr:hypothetical protein [Aeromicrobium ginsengisoli]KAA1399646.1 hypothetical protein ESP70_002475 [Aeromicrobium ginsengisoli]
MEVFTLTIAVVGLALSVASLTWQVVQHSLTGPRVQAEILWGGLGRGGAAIGPIRGDLDRTLQQGFTEPVVAVRGRNRGRMPVDIKGYGVEGQAGMSLSRFAWDPNPPLPHRLESGSEVTFYVPLEDVHRLIDASETLGPYNGRIRGSLDLSLGKTVKSGWEPFPKV